MDKRISALRNITGIQCAEGNWNYDPYMHGMANGLILALAIMEEKNPEYLSAPKEWLSGIPTRTKERNKLTHLENKIRAWQRELQDLEGDI